MIIADDRINTAKVTLRGFCQLGRHTAHILAVNIIGNLRETIKLRLINKIERVAETAADWPDIVTIAQIGFFIADIEEQTVRNDWTTQGRAPALLAACVKIGSVDRIGLEALIEIGVEG